MALARTARQSRLAHKRKHDPTCAISLASLTKGRVDVKTSGSRAYLQIGWREDLAVEIPEPEFHQVLAEWLQFFARSGHWPGQHVLQVPTNRLEP